MIEPFEVIVIMLRFYGMQATKMRVGGLLFLPRHEKIHP